MTKAATYYFFLGIGGIGMSALARYFNAKGYSVAGYDKTSTELTEKLSAEGIEIIYDDNVSLVPKDFLEKENCKIIYTPAIPKNSVLFQYFTKGGYTISKRAEVLGDISSKHFTIAVAGTHGKTTISILIAHLLKSSGFKINALLGGISHNFNSNVVLEEGAEILVTEADEYDQSFLKLNPNIAVISSVDADHLDIYGEEQKMLDSYALFGRQISKDGILISKPSILEQLKPEINSISYTLEGNADFHAENIRVLDANHSFDLHTKDWKLTNMQCGIPGIHNIENSVAAIAVALQLGTDMELLDSALRSFKGVKRRFDVHVKNEKCIYIDDYAHHPKEIEALLKSVRKLYPNKKITGIFQPHLFSRTRDFADAFASSLSLLDELILLDIYPAREEPIEGINSAWLLQKVKIKNKELSTMEEVVDHLENKNIEVLLSIGAGNIDKLVQPLIKKMEKC